MEEFYQKISYFLEKHGFLKKTVLFFTKYFPYFVLIVYPCLLFYLLITKNSMLIHATLKPLVAFLFVTILRKIIHRPRPFEIFSIEPLISHKSGESFPSRHCVSAFIIAFVCFYANNIFGILMCIIALLLSIGRILCGVHFISDVLCSFFIAGIIFIVKIF